jgi:hypothetical protein
MQAVPIPLQADVSLDRIGRPSPFTRSETVDPQEEASLKRKYILLERENAELSENLAIARRAINRLEREKKFILERLLEFEGQDILDSSDTDTNSSESESSSDLDGAESDDKLFSIKVPKPIVEIVAPEEPAAAPDAELLGLCTAVVRNRPCRSKALSGSRYCWHHAPLDPNSPFIWCQYRDPSKKNKKCSIPVLKSKASPYCKYHENKADEQPESASASTSTGAAASASTTSPNGSTSKPKPKRHKTSHPPKPKAKASATKAAAKPPPKGKARGGGGAAPPADTRAHAPDTSATSTAVGQTPPAKARGTRTRLTPTPPASGSVRTASPQPPEANDDVKEKPHSEPEDEEVEEELIIQEDENEEENDSESIDSEENNDDV